MAKQWLQHMMAGLAIFASASLSAQSYPDRAIRIINPFPAGGSGDVVMRTVLDKVGAAIGQSFVIEARPGAAGAIATDFANR